MPNKRRPQGDGTIRKRADGRWEGRIIIGHKNDGSPMYKSVFSKTQKATLKQLHRLIDLYRDVDLTEECRMTLGEWLDKWLDEYMIFTIKESTVDGYRKMIKNQIKPYLGDRQLAYLTTADIQKFYNKIKKQGRVKRHPVHGYALADSMVRGVHMLLHEALDMGGKERLIVRNPTIGTTIPKKSVTEKQVLCDSQLDRFIATVKQEPYWHDFFYTEIMTGLRRGEICGLKWSDINFTDNTLSVKRSVSNKRGGGVEIGETKTDAGVRKIIMPPSLAALLQEKRNKAVNEWVFPHYANPSEPLHPDLAYTKLKTMLKRAGLPLIRFHDLRHTFATHAMQGGVDAKTLAGILGHTDASFTLNIYSHITDTMRLQAAVKIDRKIGGTDAPISEPKNGPSQTALSEFEGNFEPYKPKCRKSGTGCVYQVSDSLWEGSFYPRLPDGKRKKFNVYAKTREECEKKLAEMIAEKKAEIKALKQAK